MKLSKITVLAALALVLLTGCHRVYRTYEVTGKQVFLGQHILCTGRPGSFLGISYSGCQKYHRYTVSQQEYDTTPVGGTITVAGWAW
jgi:hypothetical protein